MINCFTWYHSDEVPVADDWYHKQLLKIKKKVRDASKLRASFEAIDKRNQGIVNIYDFRAVLSNLKVGMTVEELARFTKYIEKDVDHMIDYYRFVRLIEDIPVDQLDIFSSDNQKFDRLSNISMVLCNYLK